MKARVWRGFGAAGIAAIGYSGPMATDAQVPADVHAQAALWRAERWTYWIPAMVLGPVAAQISTVAFDVGSTARLLIAHPDAPVSIEWLDAFVTVAVSACIFALAWFLAWAFRRGSPRMARGSFELGWRGLLRLFGMLGMIIAIGWHVGLPLIWLFVRTPDHNNPRLLDPWIFHTLLVGTALITLWIAIRRGHAITCSRCNYAMSSRFKSAPNCPECNNAWKRLGGTTYGRRLPLWVLIVGVVVYLGATLVGAAVI